jgi:hypothetical protein
LRTAGLHIPETYKVLHNVQKEEEHFLFISESMNEQSTQVPSCNKEQFNSVLQYLAKMHAVHHGTLANAQDAALKVSELICCYLYPNSLMIVFVL